MNETTPSRSAHRAKLQARAKEESRRAWRSARKIVLVLFCLAVVTQLIVLLLPDPSKATLETVADTDSQEFLFEIATRGRNSDIAVAAVKKLTNQSLLAEVAMRDSHGSATQATLRVHEPELLAKIAVHSKDDFAIYVATLKVRDQAVFERISLARDHQYTYANEFAVMSIVDSDILRVVAKEAMSRRVRVAAVRRLNEPKMIRDFILAEGGTDTLYYLDGHDEELREIALYAARSSLRGEALAMLKNPKYVEEVLQKHPAMREEYNPKDREWIPRRKRVYPVSKITDRDELFRMAIRTPISRVVRGTAAYRLAELNRAEAMQKRKDAEERVQEQD